MTKPSTIAIDGPAAVGKSTVGRLLAQKLGYRFLDTGAMYRALTWIALKYGINVEDERALANLSLEVKVEARTDNGVSIIIDGCDTTQALRQPEVERNVSTVAKVPDVRRAMVSHQRVIAQGGNIVVVGRDIGTVVLPKADLKIFLTASPEVRAHRRYLELLEEGKKVDYKTILMDSKRRDKIDSERSVAPLRQAPDARVVNTDGLTLEQVVERIWAMIEDG